MPSLVTRRLSCLVSMWWFGVNMCRQATRSINKYVVATETIFITKLHLHQSWLTLHTLRPSNSWATVWSVHTLTELSSLLPKINTPTMAHLADAKALVDNRGLYQGQTVHGMNPLLLIEKIIRYYLVGDYGRNKQYTDAWRRERIFESLYWKEQTFGLNAATVCDRAVELTYIGGQFGNQKPTPFLCLAFKLLQLQPEKEIVLEYLNDPDFK